jgi:hypothetical protein
MNAVVRQKSRTWLYGPFVVLGIIAAGWSGLWFYGRSKINEELDKFFARQAQIGRDWSCPNRTIGGFPFRIEGRCDNPTYRQRGEAGEIVNGALKGLTVVAQTSDSLSLGHVITNFEGPLVVRSPGVADVTVTWKTALSSIRAGVNRLERASVEIDSPVVSFAGGNQWTATKVQAHLREGVDAATPGAYDIAIRIENAKVPDTDAFTNSTDAINLELDARVLKMGAIDRRDWRRTLDNWRTNGGTLKVEQIRLSKGAPRLDAKGDLSLDSERRLQGRLDASFVNAGAILQQFGLTGQGGVGGLVGALLGGNRPGGAQRDMAIRLPLNLEGGRVSLGPFRIPGVQLKPVY